MQARVTLAGLVAGFVVSTGAMAATLTGSPDPAPVCDGSKLAQITINWNASDTNPQRVEVHVGSPTGSLFASGMPVGSAPTGKWVTTGTTFFLVNSANKQVLAQYTANLTTSGCSAAGSPSATPEPKGFWRRLFGK